MTDSAAPFPLRPPSLRVVLSEDELLLREGPRLMLAGLGLDVLAGTADADRLPQLVAEHRPDLVLSQHVQRRYALALLDTGADGIGYLLEQRILDLQRFGADLHTVARGGTVIDPPIVGTALTGGGTDPAVQQLTARQLQVFELLAQGRGNAAIATALAISERAVKDHTANVYRALALLRRTALPQPLGPCPRVVDWTHEVDQLLTFD